MRACLTPELYLLLVLKPNVVDPCKNLNHELAGIFEAESAKDFLSSLKNFKNKNSESKEAVFVSKIFKTTIGAMNDENKLKLMKKRESNFSHYLIWPLMEAISCDLSFEIGEYKLLAISKETARRNDTMLKNLSYKSDGCHTLISGKKLVEV